MSLLAMPDEILILIFSCISEEKGVLCSAALVNRRLANIIRPILPRSLDITLGWSREWELESCQQYLRSCSKRPELGQETRKVSIVWLEIPPPRLEQSKTVDIWPLLDRMIVKWSKIEELEIYSPHHSGKRFLTSLYRHRFPELRHLDLTLPSLSIPEVLHFMKLPKLRSLRVDRVKDSRHPTAYGRPRQITTCIEVFHTTWRPLHPATLQRIVSSSQSTLTTLHCAMPGTPKYRWSRYDLSHRNYMLDTFSPAALKDVLQPVQATLTSLKLTTGRMSWPSHDQSRLDLVEFVSLKDVSLSSLFLFGNWPSAFVMTGVWRLLPASIEELTVGNEIIAV